MRTLSAAFAVLAFATAGCGAPGVRRLAPEIKTCAVGAFTNATAAEQVPGLLTEELRRAFRLDGRLTIVDSPAAADAVVGGTVVLYDRQPARFDSTNVV